VLPSRLLFPGESAAAFVLYVKRYYKAMRSPCQWRSFGRVSLFLQARTDAAIIESMATKDKTEAQKISEAMGLLGKRSTPKKRNAALTNGAATRWQAKPLEELKCVCGHCPDNPKTYCPRGRAIIRRAAKAIAQVNQAQTDAQGTGSMTDTIEYSNQAPEVDNFAALAAQRQREIKTLLHAPEAEREAALEASVPIAAAYYATPEGREELADWRAIQGEPFHG